LGRDRLSVWSEYGFTQYALKEWVASSTVGRAAFEFAALRAADVAALRGDAYRQADQICRAVRLLETQQISSALRSRHKAVLQLASSASAEHDSPLLQSYLASNAAKQARHLYLQHGAELAACMKFPRQPDDPRRQGNLLVLKPFDPATGEKGVLYLQYTESILSFAALFDLAALARRYRLVLEPSTWGYQDASFLLLLRQGFDVIVQAQDAPDYEYVRGLASNLRPIRLGAGDWIDPQLFTAERTPKVFDFVMVASWSPVKRHTLFFASLAAAGLQRAPVALIGYPWEGRTRADIERAAADYGIANVTIFERIPRQEVARVVRSSRVGVMLSRREGANRGVYECLFCDVPVVISRANRGFNKDHINAATGRLADDETLGEVLAAVLAEHERFAPRAWAEGHTGYLRASKTLNEFLRQLARERGEPYQTDIAVTRSAPYAMYVDDADWQRLQPERAGMTQLLRAPA
jgi:hypothetical protein